jgi:hypothetical protein
MPRFARQTVGFVIRLPGVDLPKESIANDSRDVYDTTSSSSDEDDVNDTYSSSSDEDDENPHGHDDGGPGSLPSDIPVTDDHFETGVMGKTLILQCRVPGV